MAKLDYAQLPTEKVNPRTKKMDRVSITEVLKMIQREDEKVPKAVAKAQPQIERAVNLIVHHLRNNGRLFFAGAGTSGRLGVLEAAECPPTFNTPPGMIQAVMAGGKKAVFRSQEGAEDRKDLAYSLFLGKLREDDVVVGIAASGVTPFVAGALEAAREKRTGTILVACNPASPFRKLVDCLISLNVGPEVLTGSTRLKAGTATKLVLNMLTVTSMIQLGKVYQNWMVDLQPKSQKLTARALRIIQRLGKVSPGEAEYYFGQARKSAKIAILMARKKCSYQEAVKKLKKNSGFLERSLAS